MLELVKGNKNANGRGSSKKITHFQHILLNINWETYLVSLHVHSLHCCQGENDQEMISNLLVHFLLPVLLIQFVSVEKGKNYEEPLLNPLKCIF